MNKYASRYSADDYRARAGAGMTMAEASRDMDVSIEAVRRMAMRHRINFRQRGVKDDIVRLYKSRLEINTISEELGISIGYVRRVLVERGERVRRKAKREKIPGHPKLNDKFKIHAQTVRAMFFYDPITGILRYKDHPKWKGNIKEGAPAGIKWKSGYVMVLISGTAFRAHRLAWVLYYGGWPDGVIDHINGDKADNRISNLRDVTLKENSLAWSRERYGDMRGVHKMKERGGYAVRFGMKKTGRIKSFGFFTNLDKAKERAREIRENPGPFNVDV